jgi:hypothetical protein
MTSREKWRWSTDQQSHFNEDSFFFLLFAWNCHQKLVKEWRFPPSPSAAWNRRCFHFLFNGNKNKSIPKQEPTWFHLKTEPKLNKNQEGKKGGELNLTFGKHQLNAFVTSSSTLSRTLLFKLPVCLGESGVSKPRKEETRRVIYEFLLPDF